MLWVAASAFARTFYNQLLTLRYRWTRDGADVDVYVFDTGIQETHHEFGGRVEYSQECHLVLEPQLVAGC